MAEAKGAKAASTVPNPLEDAKTLLAPLLVASLKETYPDKSLGDDGEALVRSTMMRPKTLEHGELNLPCFTIAKKLGAGAPNAVAEKLAQAVQEKLNAGTGGEKNVIEKVTATGGYVNFHLSLSFLGTAVVAPIISGAFLKPLPSEGKQRVMIEYSQPNTHKAFHVGHMRNAALGDCFVRLYEQLGHPVVAANYFGDEGAHVAKCLWYMKRHVEESKVDLSTIPVRERGEWLGAMYSAGVDMLDLSTLTDMPFPGVRAAKVVEMGPHPDSKAPANWHVVKLEYPAGSFVTVVCGGTGYSVGDMVAYLPVGADKDGQKVEPKDMMGVMSSGIMLAEKELGIEPKPSEAPKKEKPKRGEKKQEGKKEEGKKEEAKKEKGKKEEAKKEEGKKEEDKAGKKDKKGKAAAPANNQIFILPATLKPGDELVEAGRRADAKIPAESSVLSEFKQRDTEVRQMLKDMEEGKEGIKQLWEETKQWSLEEFRHIYKWLGCRFDHDFYESEVGADSLAMVEEYLKKGVLQESNGAVGADLKKWNLGFCLLRKSNGSGLYATKDLALAKRKFDQFKIDRSIYVVDVAQTFHFQQVFKVLELMGYEQAKLCYHLPYGMVVLQSGKMSSRKGTVIFFSQLKKQLEEQVMRDFLGKYLTGPDAWSKDDVDEALHHIAVATIKWGMLNHESSKDIIFVLDQWAAKTGCTGPYLLYAYTRIRSMFREVPVPEGVEANWSLLTHPKEREILNLLCLWWPTIETGALTFNPSGICNYLFSIAQSFSSWYEDAPSVKRETDPAVQYTRLQFVNAISLALKAGLNLLGIQTLERM